MDTEHFLKRIRSAEQQERIEPWKSALAKAWAGSRFASHERISMDHLKDLLLDDDIYAQLKEVSGPWDVLRQQAKSVDAHYAMGAALGSLAEFWEH